MARHRVSNIHGHKHFGGGETDEGPEGDTPLVFPGLAEAVSVPETMLGPLLPLAPGSSLNLQFSGIAYNDGTNGNWYPPDNALAVGPSFTVSVENSAILWTDLNGGSRVEKTLGQFFSSITVDTNIGDPRAAYDTVNGRFVVIADQFTTGNNHIFVAVSKDSNPNDGWYFQSLNTAYKFGATTTWADYPMLAVDGSHLYISSNQFTNSDVYKGNALTILDTGLYSGGTSTVTSVLPYGSLFTYQPAADPNGGAFYVAYDNDALSIGHSIGSSSFIGPVSVSLGNIDSGSGDYAASQPGTTFKLDASDGRVQSAVVANGHLYAVFEVMPVGGTAAAVHWVDVNVTTPLAPTLVSQGDILGSTIANGATTFMGSIAVDGNGDILINFNASGATLLPGDYYVVHRAGAPAGTFTAPTLYQASSTFYQDPAGNSVGRWGDYTTAIADPNNPNGFWISAEYAINTKSWGTAIAQVLVTANPFIQQIAASPSTANLGVGSTVILSAGFNEAVTVVGSPSLSLNDGGTATYASGSGSANLLFTYTVQSGQNTADLLVSSLNLNGATIRNATNLDADVSTATNYNPAGTLQIDGTAPLVSSIAVSGSGITGGSGALNAGKAATLTVTMSETVTVTGGPPTLLLNDGGKANYVSGSGSSALVFGYTVQAGENTSDLTIASLSINGATIKDLAGNAADLSGATNFNPGGTLQIDTTAPVVTSVVASGNGITAGSGVLNTGKTVTFTMAVSEAVVVTGGVPSLVLNDGGMATYASGSGSAALVFGYTVQSGQNTSDLAISTLSLNGATIRDIAGNGADPTGATNYNPAGILQIDTTAPTLSSIATSGAGITSGNGLLDAGKVVTFTLTLSEAVTVESGTPLLQLNDGGVATYAGGSGTATLVFSYTVLAGQSASDLVVTSLSLNGSSLRDAAGNDAVLTGANGFNPAGTLQIDALPPAISSIATSGPGIAAGTGALNAGKTVTFTIALSEAATVAGGVPTLLLNDGGTAMYSGGSGTTSLTFTYTVQAGDNVADVAVSLFSLNGATLRDAAGNDANLGGATNLNPAGILQIDTTAPTVSAIAVSGSGIIGGSGALGIGRTATLTVTMGEPVTVSGGTPSLALNNGGTAVYTGGSGGASLTFGYTVGAGQDTADLLVASFNAGGASIRDAAGNEAVLVGAANFNPPGTLQIDTAAPVVGSIVASGAGITAGSGVLNAGKTVTLTVTMSDSVILSGGTPSLALNDGGVATYLSGSGSSTLVFAYTVQPGHNTPDLAVASLNLNGATLGDPAGNASVLAGATNYAPSGLLQIDTIAPAISSITASGLGIVAGAGVVGLGRTVTLTAILSEAVTVSGGAPMLLLNDGGTATYSAGSGTASLVFTYTVLAGQNTADLQISAASLNGAIIRDAAGNDADLSGAVNYDPSGLLRIDSQAPTVSSIAISGAGIVNGNGDLGAGKSVTLTVALSDTVTVSGTPVLLLNDGGTAVYSGGSGSNALTFVHVVQPGQNAGDLSVLSLSLAGGSVGNASGNAADLSGATSYNPAGVLQIDTLAPTVASIATSGTGIVTGTGVLAAGGTVTFTLTMSEAVTVSGGTLALALSDGGIATYTGVSGGNNLTFVHTVLPRQNTPDLTIAALNLSGASIVDGAGNPADLTAALGSNPPGTLQVDTTSHLIIVSVSADKLVGSTATTFYTFTLTLDHAQQTAETVHWSVGGSGGNPAAAADFAGGAFPSGTITFLAGDTSKTLAVGVAASRAVSPDEGFTVSLSQPSSDLTIDMATAAGTIRHLKLAAYDDAYVELQGHSLGVAAGAGVLVNDQAVSPAVASLLAGPSHGALSLTADGSFSYVPNAGFTGIDSFTYQAAAGGAVGDAGVSIYTVPVNVGSTTTLSLLALSAEEQIAATYTAFFSRGADKGGFEFWVDLFHQYLPSLGPLPLFQNIASSFGTSAEAQGIYPFLANPAGANDAQIGTFLDTVYHNLFNRGGDAAGLAYWTGQIKQVIAAGRFVGDILVNIIGGAQDPDITTVMNKVAVGLEYVHQQQQLGTSWSGAQDGASSVALLQAVTSDPQTVLVGMKQADALIHADLH